MDDEKSDEHGPADTHAGSPEHRDLVDTFSRLGDTLFNRYQETGKVEDLDEAIANAQRAVEATTLEDGPGRAARLGSLGDMLFSLYERTGKIEDLEAAISNTQKAVQLIPHNGPDLATTLDSLGNMLSSRFERIGNTQDMEDAIKISRRVVDITPPEHPDMAAILNNLGNKLFSQYKRTGRIQLLNEAIGNMQRAMNAAPQEDPDLTKEYWVTSSSNLASMLLNRFKRLGKMEDLQTAISHVECSISFTSESDLNLAARLSYLGNLLVTLHSRTRNDEDLERAISTTQRAVDLTPLHHPNLAPILSSLSSMLSRRYKETGDAGDLATALLTMRRVIDITPQDHPNMPSALNNFGNRLLVQYRRTGNIEHLEQATISFRKGVDMTPQGHPSIAVRLCNLGNALIQLYEREGRTMDLDEAIAVTHRATKSTPEDHPDLFISLHTLGNELLRRYQRSGDMKDLHEALNNQRMALRLAPCNHPDFAKVLSSLGSILNAQYNRTKVLKNLVEAIEIAQRVVNVTPQNHPSLDDWLINLGNYLLNRYKHLDNAEDLEEALKNTRRAVANTPPGHPALAARLNNLGTMQFSRHGQAGKPEDLEETISILQRAVDLTPEGHPDLTTRLKNLGHLLSSRHEASKQAEEGLDGAIRIYEKSFRCDAGVPQERIAAARHAIQLLVKQGNLKRATGLAGEAVGLLPLVCSRYLSYEDQQHAIFQIGALAADACSLYLRTERDPIRALEVLEHGRGLIIGYLIDLRGDLSDFRKTFSGNAAEFETLRSKAFASSVSADDQSAIGLQLHRERDEAAKAMERCIQDIRKLPGQDRFLLPPSVEDLKSSASDGPVVVVNITNVGSDAIVVTPSDIKAIELKKMRGSELGQYRQLCLTRGARDGKLLGTATDGNNLRSILSRLWSDCVCPILDELGFRNRSSGDDQELPRIWWIGTGLASSLPFHAAGVHSLGSADNTLSCAISSYTPTIRALRHSRANIRTRRHIDKDSVLLVTMWQTPGWADLPGVKGEEEAICRAVKKPHHILSLKQPRKDAVLGKLKDFSIAHFACHGCSDLEDPSSSFLAVQGDSETAPDKLTVREIANLDLGQAWLAYLSACSSAESNVPELSDEALHLASAFQVAGFGHVVASMWTSDDSICAQVANVFYGHLTEDGDLKRDGRAVAAALQAAVMEIRAENLEKPHLWAQYIHLGA